MIHRLSPIRSIGQLLCLIVAVLALLLFRPPELRAADDTSPTLTAVYSDIGTIGDITIPAVEVPVPPPFRPLVVAGSVSADASSVRVAFEVPAGTENAPSRIAAAVVPADAVIEDPGEIVAQGVVADIAADGTAVNLTIPVIPAEFPRSVKIVFVGIRYDETP